MENNEKCSEKVMIEGKEYFVRRASSFGGNTAAILYNQNKREREEKEKIEKRLKEIREDIELTESKTLSIPRSVEETKEIAEVLRKK